MKPIHEVNLEPISFQTEPLTEAHLNEFRASTNQEFTSGFPATYPTTLRKAEFEYLDRFEVDMRLLLHLDQEYIYLKPLKIGDSVTITTRVGEVKEKRGLHFVTLYTDLVVKGETRVRSNTTFVVRTSV